MLKKHVLCAITLLSTAALHANIPIESRGLSQGGNDFSTPNNAVVNTTGNTAPVPTNPTWQLMQKNQQLENEIRSLRGKMEEQDNEIEKLKKELTNRYTDLDQRLELLQQKIDPEENTPVSEEDNQQDSSPSPAAAIKPSPINNTAPVKPVVSNSTPPATKLPQAAVAQPRTTPTELEKAAYTVALDAYKQGGAKKAIAPMQNFIKNHPDSIYISNAHFWLAEFYLAIEPTNYAEAKKGFSIVAEQYPNSAKASNAVYRLYSIAKDVDHNNTLAAKYKNKLLSNYPKSEEAGFIKK